MKDFFRLIYLRPPNQKTIERVLEVQSKLFPNYSKHRSETGCFRDSIRVQIGEGKSDFLKARQLVQNWQVFNTKNGYPFCPTDPPQTSQTTLNLLQELGLWWLFACRITQTTDSSNLYNFTFETLPGHVESGWETFQVQLEEKSGIVFYSIESECSHRFMLCRLLAPIVRWRQQAYKKSSARSMVNAMLQK